MIHTEQKDKIKKELMRKDKVGYFLDTVILPELQIGYSVKYDKLITVMKFSDDTTAQYLADELMQG